MLALLLPLTASTPKSLGHAASQQELIVPGPSTPQIVAREVVYFRRRAMSVTGLS